MFGHTINLNVTLELKGITMTQLSDAMNAAIATLESQHGVTTDQVSSIVSQAIAPLQTSINTILASEQSDEAKIADVTAAVTEFTTAFAPAPTPAPAPAPASSASGTSTATTSGSGTASA